MSPPTSVHVTYPAPTRPAAGQHPRASCNSSALLVEKFVLGRPVHRIAAGLAHDRLNLAQGTLAGMFAACSALLAPLAAAISDHNAAAAHPHVDEARWNVNAALAQNCPGLLLGWLLGQRLRCSGTSDSVY